MQPPTILPAGRGATTRHLRAAIYLAGQAVECILKAYFISREPPAVTLTQAVEARRERGEDVPNIMSAAGHSLPLLISLTDLEALLAADAGRRQDWTTCARWRSTWRYNPEPPDANFAGEFVRAARRFHDWVQQQL